VKKDAFLVIFVLSRAVGNGRSSHVISEGTYPYCYFLLSCAA